MKKLLFLCLGLLMHDALLAQDTLSIPNKRLRNVSIAVGSGYVIGMTGLYQAWYKEGMQKQFVWFNDNPQWKQMDKMGHFYSAYHIAAVTQSTLHWSGVSMDRSYLLGSVLSSLAMLPIEIFDGFSPDYGASWGDLLANSAGAFFLYGQYKVWHEPRITPKLSFSPSRYASLRPNTLGANLPEQILKDYNGHTHWWSVKVQKFMKEESRYPKWLNIAIGYGAEEMIYGRDYENKTLANLHPYRQYYLSLDLDFSHYKSDKWWVNSLLYVVNCIHLPAPALEFNSRKGVIFHPIFF